MYEKVKTLILQHLPGLQQTPSGWQKRNCIMCHHRGHRPDSRQRMGIKFSHDSVGINCFNCGFSAVWDSAGPFSKKFMNFLQSAGIEQRIIKNLQFELYKKTGSVNPRKNKLATELEDTIFEEVELPEGSKTLSQWADEDCTDKNFIECIEYLENRRLLYPNHFYWTPNNGKKMFSRRITLPFYIDNKIVGYTARHISKNKSSKIPKYINKMQPGFVYNLHNQFFNQRKYVILTEGILDAFCCDGISIMGEVSDKKIHAINTLDKEIIVCPDRDKSGIDLINAAIDNNWKVTFPKWENDVKDLAQAVERYGKILSIESVFNEVVDTSFEIKLRRRMDKYKG